MGQDSPAMRGFDVRGVRPVVAFSGKSTVILLGFMVCFEKWGFKSPILGERNPGLNLLPGKSGVEGQRNHSSEVLKPPISLSSNP